MRFRERCHTDEEEWVVALDRFLLEQRGAKQGGRLGASARCHSKKMGLGPGRRGVVGAGHELAVSAPGMAEPSGGGAALLS
jgi:hypothetical protein